jgi:hypothetical protein
MQGRIQNHSYQPGLGGGTGVGAGTGVGTDGHLPSAGLQGETSQPPQQQISWLPLHTLQSSPQWQLRGGPGLGVGVNGGVGTAGVGTLVYLQ